MNKTMTKYYYAFPTHILVSDSKRPTDLENYNMVADATNVSILGKEREAKEKLSNWLSQCEQINYADGQKELFFTHLAEIVQFFSNGRFDAYDSGIAREAIADGILIEGERVELKKYCRAPLNCNDAKQCGACEILAYFVPVPTQRDFICHDELHVMKCATQCDKCKAQEPEESQDELWEQAKKEYDSGRRLGQVMYEDYHNWLKKRFILVRNK